MRNLESHLTEQELLSVADGELPTRLTAQAREHLAACWDCRSRMAEIERTIVDFTHAYRENLDPQLPPREAPSARLRAQLAELATKSDPRPRLSIFQWGSFLQAAAHVSVILLVALTIGRLLFEKSSQRQTEFKTSHSVELGVVPNRNLTPGATRSVTIREVCSMAHEDVVRAVSGSIRQQIFQEYGMVNANATDYEIDYLIAPGLGGSADIHNLWPEPYSSPTWNAHVKDDLEERLHEMVCAGQLDLSTAQRDIAVDWIAAYKKYFHSDKLLPLNSLRVLLTGSPFVASPTAGRPALPIKKEQLSGLKS